MIYTRVLCTFNLFSPCHLLRFTIIWKSHKQNVGAITEKKRIVCMNETNRFMVVEIMQTYLRSIISVRTDFLLSQLRHRLPCGGVDNYRYLLSEFFVAR